MKDKMAARLMKELSRKLSEDGRQVLMVVDKFETPEGYDTLSSIEVSRKGNGVMAMLVDLIDNIYTPRGIKFKTVMDFMNAEAQARGLM